MDRLWSKNRPKEGGMDDGMKSKIDEMVFRDWFADGSISFIEVPMIMRGVPTNNDQWRISYEELTPSITMFRWTKDSIILKVNFIKNVAWLKQYKANLYIICCG